MRERALGTVVRALGLKLGVKIREKTFRDKYIWSEASEYGPKIRAEVIEKFQYFVENVKVITSRDRKILLKALIKYRKTRGQPSLKSVPTKQEWRLTQIILRAIWSEKGKFLSMRGLSLLIFNTKNYFLRFSEGNDKYGQGFEAHQVAIMEEFLSDYLTGTNKRIVIDAISNYKIATDKEGFYSFNTPEMMLAQFIRTELIKIYGELSMKKVGRKLGKYWFFRNVKSQNRPFKQSELWHIAKFMHQFALTSNAPQYVSVLKALGEYKRSYHWYHRVTEKAMLRTLLITGPTAAGYAPGFSSPLTRRLQSEILMRQFCDRDALTGDKIYGTPHRHHIKFIKSLCQIKDLAPLSARSHGIITSMAQRGKLQKAIDIISKVKEAIETQNFKLLKGIWSAQNIIDFQKELATYARDDINYYINRLP